MATQDNLLQTVERMREVSKDYLNGNPAPFQACWLQGEETTIFGAWGAYEKGWEQVGPRLAWGAERYREGESEFELLSYRESGDLAYTVWLERGEARVSGLDERRPMALRVTQIYCRTQDGWRIIHRHADAVIEKIEATAVLQ